MIAPRIWSCSCLQLKLYTLSYITSSMEERKKEIHFLGGKAKLIQDLMIITISILLLNERKRSRLFSNTLVAWSIVLLQWQLSAARPVFRTLFFCKQCWCILHITFAATFILTRYLKLFIFIIPHKNILYFLVKSF